jgi:RNA polymerase sigma-70 factor (ECF subfamily)
MPNFDQWFDTLYMENAPRMVRLAAYLLGDRQIAEELVHEACLILLYKRDRLADHPNLPGWLSQTLKNLVADELKSARHRLELPLNEAADTGREDTYEPPLELLLPPGLTPKEREILILYYEKQLSYEEIAARLNITVINCRTRLFRARARYKKLKNNEKNNTRIF